MKNQQMSLSATPKENPAPRAQLLTLSASTGNIAPGLPEVDPGCEESNSSQILRFAPAVLEEPVEADEAALFVRMSPQHLKQLAREGKVPAHPRGDGQRHRWLFFLSELAVWIRSQVNSACDPCRA
jgi:hypothetical protein